MGAKILQKQFLNEEIAYKRQKQFIVAIQKIQFPMGSNSTMTTISSKLPDPLLLKENDWIDSCPLNSQSLW